MTRFVGRDGGGGGDKTWSAAVAAVTLKHGQPNDDDPCITYSTVCVRSVVHESLMDYCGLTSAPSDDTSSRVAKYG